MTHCEICGKLLKTSQKRFCGIICRNLFASAENAKNALRYLYKCKFCGKSYTVKASRKKLTKYCSKSCGMKARMKKRWSKDE